MINIIENKHAAAWRVRGDYHAPIFIADKASLAIAAAVKPSDVLRCK
jgi:hypothetical protein